MKDSWIFQNVKDNVNGLTLGFWQTYVQCYELNKVIQQFNMLFIQMLWTYFILQWKYKWYSINSICSQYPPNNFIIPYLFYKNKLMKKHNETVFINTWGPTFIFKAMDINHQSCLPCYKLLNNSRKIASLHYIICIRMYILVEICVGNYATSNGLVNGANGIFKTSITLDVKYFKIGIVMRKNI